MGKGQASQEQKGQVVMKTRIVSIGRMTGMALGAGILLGCGVDPTSVLQAEKADGTDSVLTTNAPSQINSEELDQEPILKAEPAPFKTSPGVGEVVKMAESGVGDTVIKAYVENSPIAYALSADEILYLTDLGISEPILDAMIRHGNLLRDQEAKAEDSVAAVKKSLAEEQKAEQQNAEPTPGVAPPATENLPPAPQYVTPPLTPPEQVYADAPQQVNYFYGSLSPYGSWFDLPGSGWCWRPTAAVVDPGWRPYSHRGHWLYSNCGWYWQSDYSWGWAPFHYGRWHNHPKSGWVWFPDSVWAPAWVTWRYTDSHCGWAPLPPATHCGPGGLSYHGVSVGVGWDFGMSSLSFSFVSRSHFADRNPHRYILPPAQAQTVYAHSKVINNIVVDKNNTVINNGIGYERIAAVSRQEIRKVVVRDPPTVVGKGVKRDRIEKDGSSLVVYRPQIQAQTPARNAFVPTRAQQELRKDSGAATQPNAQTANQRHAVQNSGLPLAPSKPIAVTSISSRDEQTLIKTRTELPAAGNLAGRSHATPPILNNSKPVAEPINRPQSSQTGKTLIERGVQSSGGPIVTMPQPASKPKPDSDSVNRTQSVPGRSPQTVASPQVVKPINERPGTTVPAQPRYSAPLQTAQQQPVNQPQQQPYIVGQPNRQEITRQAPAARNYAQPQVVPQQAYRPQSIAPTYSAPPVAQPAPQRYYSPPPTAQPAYRPAPVYSPPARTAPVQAQRAQPQASPARQNSDKK